MKIITAKATFFLYLALQSIVKHFDFTEANEVIKDRLQTFRIRHNHLNHVRFKKKKESSILFRYETSLCANK